MEIYDVIGYTYEADHHCVECTKKRHSAGGFKLAEPSDTVPPANVLDQHGIPYAATDNENNLVGVIFAGHDREFADNGCYCGDCGAEIVEAPTDHD